jgi:hypothetical protein
LAEDVRRGRSGEVPVTQQVDDFMRALDHPFKAEMQAVREIILGANERIAERIKWKVPSFYYRADLAAFHPRNRECVHVVMVFPHGLVDDPAGLLQGNYAGRRMLYFADMAQVRADAAALAGIVNAWVRLEEEQG